MTDAAHGVAVTLDGLTIRAGRRELLRDVHATFEPGQVTLVLGPSGAGKSLLLRAIAGLFDRAHDGVAVRGAIRFAGDARRRVPVGVVFQYFALFDELSPVQNVAFAHAHRQRRDRVDRGLEPAALLDELGVPRDVPTGRLSGGQQQRLAIARTLTYDPDVVLYDEPTSGLDAAASEQVAKLIADTQSHHPKTAIVVTHDYESLVGIADVIYLLDAEQQTLRRVPREEWGGLRQRLIDTPTPAASRGTAPRGLVARGLDGLGAFFAGSTSVVEAAVALPLRLIPLWRRPLWGLRYLGHYLNLVAGLSAWIYLAMTGIILGFVATYFTFTYLPYADYTEPLVIEEVLGTVGYGLFRILIPLLATVLIAARCGAAVASDVGNKTYGRQIDALRSLGVSPSRYLLTNVLYSFLIGAPLLTLAAFFTARWTSLAVFTASYPALGPAFWDEQFHAAIRVPGEIFYDGAWWMIAKTLACALGIGLIAYHQGARPKASAAAVSRAITATILWSTLHVLMVHFVFAFYEFEAAG